MDNYGERVGSDDEDLTAVEAPSVLSSLKERREQILEEQTLRLPVPRWNNPSIVVIYKPVEHSLIRGAQKKVEKAKGDRQSKIEVESNIDILIKGCVGVVAVLDGQDYSLRPGDENGEPTLFDADLADNLGVEGMGGRPATARDVVRALFLTEGDILSAGMQLIEFSGYKETEADEQLLGE